MKQRDDWHLTEAIEHQVGRGDPFAAAVRATRMPMVITDPNLADNPIVFCNEAFQKLTGYDRDEIVGRNCRFLQGDKTDPVEIAKLRDAIGQGMSIDVDILNYRKDGSTFWNALYLSPVRDEDGTVRFFFASQMDVTERVEARDAIARQKADVEAEVESRTADLKTALEAKTLLLHEVDHRVKNNLTMIGSLLRLQARTIADPTIADKLETMLERVDALANVHRRLYQADDITRFDVGGFAASLMSDVLGASGRGDIVANVDVESIEVPSSVAAALGLVLNEILTNAVKHAFADGRPGILSLRAHREGDQASISISDDGPGTEATRPSPDGLGRTLINRLSKQVGATATWSALSPGTRVTLRFPMED